MIYFIFIRSKHSALTYELAGIILNYKYHSTYKKTGNKEQSLIDMVSKMGVVTLFCNLTAAIGFAVFALTKSAILKEFGQVAGSV